VWEKRENGFGDVEYQGGIPRCPGEIVNTRLWIDGCECILAEGQIGMHGEKETDIQKKDYFAAW
jgi:hypothetical protein